MMVIVPALPTMLVVYTRFAMPPQPAVFVLEVVEMTASPIDGVCGLKPGMQVEDMTVEIVAPAVSATDVKVLTGTPTLLPPPPGPPYKAVVAHIAFG